MISHILFDFFGTLVGYTHGHFRTDSHARTFQLLRERQIPLSYEQFSQQFSAIFQQCEAESRRTLDEFHIDVVSARFFQTLGVAVEPEFLRQFSASYIADWDQGTVYLPEIAPFIRRMASAYRLGVISNTHDANLVHGNLAAMGVADCFEIVVTSDVHGRRKPASGIFLDTLARLGVPPAQAAYVGDTYADDYEGARACGMRGILIDAAGAYVGKLEDRIDSLFDLPDLLGMR